ncbi:MAG TPA: PTS sugar transporter subunit IIA, partial [Symbiobacteriaceae bacterium]|nr:PTS sugar transporter subunit IIA [Symbiobacteriaceae bacterium]
GSVLDPVLLLPQTALTDKEQILAQLAELLTQSGYVRSDFLDGVLEREEMGPAVLGGQMAIPHADPTRVRRPGIAVAVLERPIPWGFGMAVDVVCMAALTADAGNLVLELNEVAGQPARMERLRQAKTKQALLEAFQ